MCSHSGLSLPVQPSSTQGECRTSAVSFRSATLAVCTPGCALRARSTAPEHDAQCIPLTDTCRQMLQQLSCLTLPNVHIWKKCIASNDSESFLSATHSKGSKERMCWSEQHQGFRREVGPMTPLLCLCVYKCLQLRFRSSSLTPPPPAHLPSLFRSDPWLCSSHCMHRRYDKVAAPPPSQRLASMSARPQTTSRSQRRAGDVRAI